MNNSDIQKFVDKNKDNIQVIKDLSGTIIGIKVINKNKVDFTDTNCKFSKDWDRDVIVTNDGQKFDVSYPTKKEVVTAWAGRTFKQIKTRAQNFKLSDIPNGLVSLGTKINNTITPLTDKLMGVEKYEPVPDPAKPTATPKAVARATGPVANFNEQKSKSDNLTIKLDEILKKYENNKKYANDPEIKAFRQRLTEIKSRYDFAMSRNDAPEMLNVKTKLVKLSGMIIAKQNNLDKVKDKGKGGKEPPKRKPKQKKTKPKTISPKEAGMIKAKAARTRFINQYEKAMAGFDKSIALYTQKINIYRNEINLLENNIANIDQIAKDNNFDSRETGIYLDDQKAKLADMQAKLKEVEEQLKQEEEKKNAYNEEYVEVKYKNEFEPDGYIKKKEKRGYAYKKYMQEKNLEERIKIAQEVKKDNEEIAAMEAKLAEMKAKRDAKLAEDQKKYEEGSKYSLAGDNPNAMAYHEEELEPKDKPKLR